ncbi:MAG: cobalamin-dependent protein [Syntrophotaleaceae bacterium]
MNILLIYPEFPDTFWSFKHALKLAHKKASSPPLGLLTVAALLPARWDKRLLDLNVTQLVAEDLAWADMVLISAMLVQQESVRQVIERCRLSGVRIVAGGPLFTNSYEQFPQVDHFVLNEGELTLPRFLADFAEGRAERVYATGDFADIQQSPAPLWDLLRHATLCRHEPAIFSGLPLSVRILQRDDAVRPSPRTKSTHQVLAELDGLYARGWRGSVFFVDDNFIGNKRHLKGICCRP